MEDDELLQPLPELDGDEDEPEPSRDFGDGLAAELVEGDEDVGLDASTGADASAGAHEDLAGYLELPADEAGGLSDEAGPEAGLGELIDDAEAEPPPLSASTDEAPWDDLAEVEEAPPLGVEDGGELGLEEPHLEGGGLDDDVELPPLDREPPGSERGAASDR